MAKIYIAENNSDYEGFIILGAFETQAEAEWCCKRDQCNDWGYPFDSWRIEVLEIGQSRDVYKAYAPIEIGNSHG